MLYDALAIMGLFVILIILGEILISIAIALIVKFILKRFFNIKIIPQVFLMIVGFCFFLVNVTRYIPSMLESREKSSYVLPETDTNFNVNNINKVINGDEVTVTFTITPAHSSDYQLMPSLTPAYKLISINGTIKSKDGLLPRMIMEKGIPMDFTFVFKNSNDLPNYFEITFTPKSPEFTFDGYSSITLTGDSSREMGWIAGKHKDFKRVYIKEFNFNNY